MLNVLNILAVVNNLEVIELISTCKSTGGGKQHSHWVKVGSNEKEKKKEEIWGETAAFCTPDEYRVSEGFENEERAVNMSKFPNQQKEQVSMKRVGLEVVGNSM